MTIKDSLKAILVTAVLGAALGVAPAGAGVAAASGTPYQFRNVVIGGGGYSPSVVFSPATAGLAYLRTDIGGAYRWEDTAGHWVPLLDWVTDSRLMGVESIAPDPVDAQRVYVAVGMYSSQKAAILRSDDRGAHWQMEAVPFAMGGNEDGRGMGERLAVDPYQPGVLLFGSRHDGMWRSTDHGANWSKLTSFPDAGLGAPAQYQTHAGISFVTYEVRAGSRRVVAGVADRGHSGLYLSEDGGATWRALPGSPAAMLPAKAVFSADGTLYVTFDEWIGPNGIKHGAVWAVSPQGLWRDVTPEPGNQAVEGGYMGVAVDPSSPGVVLVSSIDRWHPGDTIWRSKDGGAHWEDLAMRSRRDVSYSPWLDDVGGSEHLGHWMSGLAVDPFHPGRVAYTTGATVFMADQLADSGPANWQVWTRGIEETVPLTMTSPTDGAPLISGLGDIGGFAHDNLDKAPSHPHTNPFLPNTNSLDYAGLAPRFVVRSGTARNPDPATVATLALSQDGGHSWRPIRVPALSPESGVKGERFDVTGDASLVIGADGGTLVVNTPVPLLSMDGGVHWRACGGLPLGSRVISDKGDPARFYAVEFTSGLVFVSQDHAESFVPVLARTLPLHLTSLKPWGRESPFNFLSVPGRVGELWMLVDGTLWFSRDGAQSFRTRSQHDAWFSTFGLGKAAPGSSYPTIFARGNKDGVDALWRSTDGGAGWQQITAARDGWGGDIRVITGDPRVFGRVYFGTGGRGIMLGEPKTKP